MVTYTKFAVSLPNREQEVSQYGPLRNHNKERKWRESQRDKKTCVKQSPSDQKNEKCLEAGDDLFHQTPQISQKD